MATIQNSFKTTVDNRINNKTVDYSIAKQDIGNTFNEMVDLLGATEANVDLQYNKGWFVKKTGTPMRFYVAINDNVDGDVTNTNNWVELTTEGIGNGRLVSKVVTEETTAAQIFEDTYIPSTLVLADNSGALYRYIITGVQTTTTWNLAYVITIDLTDATDGDCVLLDMQTMGSGQNILLIDEITNVLSSGATYLVTYQEYAVDGKNYTIRQVSENGFTRVLNTTNALLVGTGKVLVNIDSENPHTIILPTPALNTAKEVEIIIQTGIVGTVSTIGGGIVGSVPLPATSGSLRFISNGQGSWIYV